MSTHLKSDISDLLPALQDALQRSRESRRTEPYWEYRSILAQVGQRYGIVLGREAGSGADGTNELIDALDRDYPDWRGYRPSYLQARCA